MPSYLSELSRHVDVSDILPKNVEISNTVVEKTNKSNEDSNKIGRSFDTKTVFVRIQKLDEDYVQVYQFAYATLNPFYANSS